MTRERFLVLRRHVLSCSLPPCGGGLGRGVAASSVFVAYPPPERFARRQGFALAFLKTAAESRLVLPHKGGGSEKSFESGHHGFHFRKFEIRASPKRWLFSG